MCHKCKRKDCEHTLLLCNFCTKACHMQCLRTPLTFLPKDEWACEPCMKSLPLLTYNRVLNRADEPKVYAKLLLLENKMGWTVDAKGGFEIDVVIMSAPVFFALLKCAPKQKPRKRSCAERYLMAVEVQARCDERITQLQMSLARGYPETDPWEKFNYSESESENS